MGRLGAGASTSTMLKRIPFLPKADAYVSEGGGRIWWHDDTLPTAACIAEDFEWRAQHASVSERPPAAQVLRKQHPVVLDRQGRR